MNATDETGAEVTPTGEQLRRSEVLAVLGLAIDLAMGHPTELAMRAGLLSLDLAERLHLTRDECVDAHLVTLLRFVGCTAHATEVSAAFGDEIALRAQFALLDPGSPRQMLPAVLRAAGAHQPMTKRLGAVTQMAVLGPRWVEVNFRTSCETAQLLVRRLHLGDGVSRGVNHAFERWDGRGVPHHISGEQIEISARIALIVCDLLVLQTAYGRDSAVELLRERAGAAYDPDIARVLVADVDDLVQAAYDGSAWDRVVAAAPERDQVLDQQGIGDALAVLADFGDAKSPYFIGRSRLVAGRMRAAMTALGAAEGDVVKAAWAGLVHDLGRTAIPNSIWEKPGPLTESEWERVRLHPYQTERLLRRAPVLAELAGIAGAHHERCDGSGYFRGSRRADLPLSACVLAAADAYVSMTSARPYRAAMTAERAGAQLREQADGGQLDPRAVEAVIAADGPPRRVRSGWPDRLTDREVEVIQLLARGRSNRQIAHALYISERTAGHHVAHILAKTGVSTRGAAGVYAVEKGLLA